MDTLKPKADSNSTGYWNGEGEDVGGSMQEAVDRWDVKGVEGMQAAYLSLREVSLGWLRMSAHDGGLQVVVRFRWMML